MFFISLIIQALKALIKKSLILSVFIAGFTIFFLNLLFPSVDILVWIIFGIIPTIILFINLLLDSRIVLCIWIPLLIGLILIFVLSSIFSAIAGGWWLLSYVIIVAIVFVIEIKIISY